MARKQGALGAADLTITSEPVEPRQVRLTIVVAPEREAREMAKVAQEYAKHLRVSGYRPGHVPMRVVAAQVGEGELRSAAREQLADKVAREAIRAEGLEPYDNPELEGQTDDPLTYTILVPLRPTVNLGDYRALRVPEPATEAVTEEEVTERIEALRAELAHLATVDRPAAAGDRAIVTVTGRLGERVLVDEEGLALDLTADAAADAQLPTDIVDHVIGLSAGDRVEVDLTYSEFWPEADLQGQTAHFTVLVESVESLALPDLNDAFAQDVSPAQTLAELRERVRESLESRRRMAAREEWVGQAVAALAEQAQVSAPPSALEAELEDELASLRARVERQGFTWERWLTLQEKDESALRAEIAPEVNRRFEQALVLGEFARAEGIRVSRSDVEGELRRQSQLLAGAGLRMRRTDEARRRMGGELLTGRALDRLLELVSGAGEAIPPPGPDTDYPDLA